MIFKGLFHLETTWESLFFVFDCCVSIAIEISMELMETNYVVVHTKEEAYILNT